MYGLDQPIKLRRTGEFLAVWDLQYVEVITKANCLSKKRCMANVIPNSGNSDPNRKLVFNYWLLKNIIAIPILNTCLSTNRIFVLLHLNTH
jgi:hypothetical protein